MFWTALALAAPPDDEIPSLPPARNPPVAAPAPTSAAPVTAPSAAGGAWLAIDAKVPVEVLLEGLKLGELYFPGEVRWSVAPGPHTVRVYVGGTPTDVPVRLDPARETRVVVGRTGVTTETSAVASAPAGPATVEFRLVGAGGAQIRLDAKAQTLTPGQPLSLTVPAGSHALSVRSVDGTVIWANGDLVVDGGQLLVMIAEGRLPEVSGSGAFRAGGG